MASIKISISLPATDHDYIAEVIGRNQARGSGPTSLSGVIQESLIAHRTAGGSTRVRQDHTSRAASPTGEATAPSDLAAALGRLTSLIPSLETATAALDRGAEREERIMLAVGELADIVAEAFGRDRAHAEGSSFPVKNSIS
jgi:hypothetical protein